MFFVVAVPSPEEVAQDTSTGTGTAASFRLTCAAVRLATQTTPAGFALRYVIPITCSVLFLER